MLAAYAFLGLIVFAIVDGLNALRSSTEKAARSWAVTMVLLPTFAGGIATLILVGAATIVGTDVSSSLARLVLVPEAALLLFLARAWRRSLAGDKDQRLRLSAVLLRSSAHPHRGFAIGLIAFLAFPVAGAVSFNLGGSSVPATEDLDPVGLAFQEAVLADGTVTMSEFEDAIAGMESCIEERGIRVGPWSVSPDGAWTFSYSSGDEIRGEAIYDICYYSYVNNVDRVDGR